MVDKLIRVAQVIGPAVNGGTEAFAMNYFEHIDREKVQFDFLVESTSKIIDKNMIEAMGGHVIIIPSYKNPIEYVHVLTKIFREHKYDIVHSNMNTLSCFTLKAAKRGGIKIRIAHSHSTSNSKEFIRNLAKNILKPFSKQYATHYFACSEKAGRYLFGNKLFDEGKVTVINNGIDLEKFKFDSLCSESIRSELGIGLDTKIIGHVGRFVRQKNHAYLLEVFKEILKRRDNVKLLLLGDGPLFQEIRNKAVEMGIESEVIFAGSKEDIYRYYSAMDLFLFPSLYEGLSLTSVEAQANGLYCMVSSNITRELKATDNIEFLDIKENPSVWAEKAIRHFDCENNIDRMSANIVMKKSKFDIKVQAIRLLGLYQRIVNHS